MVEYRHPGEPDRRLVVESADPDIVLLRAIYDGGGAEDETAIDLGRDAVAALVGQLQSWLARTRFAAPA